MKMNLTEATMKALQGKLYEDIQLTPSINKHRELYDNNVVITCDVNKVKLGKILKIYQSGAGWSDNDSHDYHSVGMSFEVVNANEAFTKVENKEYGKCILFLTVFFKDDRYYKAGEGYANFDLYFKENSDDMYCDFRSNTINSDEPEYKVLYDKCEAIIKSKGSSIQELLKDGDSYDPPLSYVFIKNQ